MPLSVLLLMLSLVLIAAAITIWAGFALGAGGTVTALIPVLMILALVLHRHDRR